MSEAITFQFEQQSFQFIKSAANWELTLKKSDITVRDPKEIALLSLENSLFMACTTDWTEDELLLSYSLPTDSQSVAEIQKLVQHEKIRALINLGEIEQLLNLPFTFFIHPENLVFDHNLIPRIAYRGLVGKMPPHNDDEANILRQYKAFILSFMEANQTFMELYEGNLETYKSTKFAADILQASSFTEIKDYLRTLYQEMKQTEETTKVRVSRNKYRLFQQLSIWMSLLLVLAAIPLGYFIFFREPFQEKLLAADTSFFKKDYESVISDLATIETEKIPFAQKYALAYSFVQGKDLSDAQKVVILNNISLKSASQYLDYWIENGRGNFDEALDIGKQTEDSDLILYALMQKIEQVRQDTSLSGTEREAQIDKLESEYDKYNKKREEALKNREGGSDNGELVTPEADETKESQSEETTKTKDSEEKK